MNRTVRILTQARADIESIFDWLYQRSPSRMAAIDGLAHGLICGGKLHLCLNLRTHVRPWRASKRGTVKHSAMWPSVLIHS